MQEHLIMKNKSHFDIYIYNLKINNNIFKKFYKWKKKNEINQISLRYQHLEQIKK